MAETQAAISLHLSPYRIFSSSFTICRADPDERVHRCERPSMSWRCGSRDLEVRPCICQGGQYGEFMRGTYLWRPDNAGHSVSLQHHSLCATQHQAKEAHEGEDLHIRALACKAPTEVSSLCAGSRTMSAA